MQQQVIIPGPSDIQLSTALATGIARALILDDSPVDRRRLKRLCDKAELTFDFTEVSTLAELQKAIAAERFDIVFIDYRLDDGDGLTALRRLKADPANRYAATIMVAGVAQAQVAVAALKGGCDDYILKDAMDHLWLQRSVNAALERSGLRSRYQESDEAREALSGALKSFSARCTNEMIPMLSRLLRQTRELRRALSQAGFLDTEAAVLEKSCVDLWTYAEGLEQSALDSARQLGR